MKQVASTLIIALAMLSALAAVMAKDYFIKVEAMRAGLVQYDDFGTVIWTTPEISRELSNRTIKVW